MIWQMRFILFAGFGLLVGTANADEPAKRGQSILVAKCAHCHAIAKSGPSPEAKAPPFRDLHLRYDAAHLAEALAEGISTGHNEMPAFVFQPSEIKAVIAYLKTLETVGDHKQQSFGPSLEEEQSQNIAPSQFSNHVSTIEQLGPW